ncbi:MAG: 2-oxoglutarate dehydrogenase E2 component (dihydrolipoamide succinyltransferase) [Saprospiraceae bacterium]|jgi:2-oxoglutarate dehydrogenase E2 component (dihydrolipoamide succinyltransferase)
MIRQIKLIKEPYRMAKVELIMPKMGESITEATILKWVKNVGDSVALDETILEIATDKVDSDIPSPVAGKIIEVLFNEDDVVEVGKVIAILATEGEDVSPSPAVAEKAEAPSAAVPEKAEPANVPFTPEPAPIASSSSSSDRFYSPLVKNIAKQENISVTELDSIAGSGANGRVTKRDILEYVANRSSAPVQTTTASVLTTTAPAAQSSTPPTSSKSSTATTHTNGGHEIIAMDRMRKLIADHMVMSKHTSPHVTSFVEADVTNIVNWRNGIKGEFQKKHGEKITFTPIFMEAVAKAINDFPLINVSIEGTNIIKKKDINIGMAAALPSGNLIVPVIKNADQLNLVGLTKRVNDLANKARGNKLKPDDIQGGTFTLTNVGTFGNVMGTPIINQPQVAIMAVGAIKKKPAVLETEHGDVIAIRHMMFLSLSYDHRVVDGFLGGSFLKKVADYLESFDTTQSF